MDILVLSIILLLRVAQNISGKSCSNLIPVNISDSLRYVSLRMGMSSIGALVLLVFSKGFLNDIVTLPAVGWFISALTGFLIAISVICSLYAMKKASIVLCTIFSATGLLIPTVFGIFMYNQSVKIGQWLGILLMLFATVLLANSSNKTNGKLTLKTILLLLGCMFSNGFIMLLQTMFKTYVPRGNVSLYSFLQFILPCIALFIPAKVIEKTKKVKKEKFSPKLYIYTAVAAFVILAISQISTVASSFIPVAVLFPISDGGNTIISAIVASIIFKEKFTVRIALSLVLGVAGLVMIKLFV